MSACSTWREQLTDYALGLPASGALLAHVASCASCPTALADWRARIQQLDAGVRQLVSSEPPPYLPSRVVAGIISRPPLYIRLQRWKTVMATIVFVLIVAVFLHNLLVMQERKKETQRAFSAAAELAHWRSPTQALLRSSSDMWLKTVPRLGESFFEPKGETYARKPEKRKT